MNVNEWIWLENHLLFDERINERNVPYKIFSGGNLSFYDFVNGGVYCYREIVFGQHECGGKIKAIRSILSQVINLRINRKEKIIEKVNL